MEQKTTRDQARILVELLISDWRPTMTQILWSIRVAIVLGILILIGYFNSVTLWDWLELLIVPAIIATVGIWFNRQQQERQLRISEHRAQDDAVQAYLDQMSQLLTDKDRPLHRARSGDNLSTVARARTLTVLQMLDGHRKRSIVQFLHEGGLIKRGVAAPVVKLDHANLKYARLRGIYLENAQLQAVYFQDADLRHSYLRGAVLYNSNLRNAKLESADLSPSESNGNKQPTNLDGVDLLNADLKKANLRGADMRQVKYLVQRQIENAEGDLDTQLPTGLTRPPHWSD
ncbi:MAG: pentapeptide repeat-containing protein [Rubrobacteraceae bacterium]